MVSRFRERLTFANVASSIALFAALSTGGAYAADKIGPKDIDKNAVKSKHLKNAGVKGKDVAADAIDSSKVADGSLLGEDFAAGQLREGTRGPEGPQGPQGPAGPKGDTGATGATGPFPEGDIPSGKTIRGQYVIGERQDTTGQFKSTSISFGFRLANAPTPHFVPEGGTPPAQCPGSATNPQAAAGHLCVYEGVGFNRVSPSIFNPSTGFSGASRWGAGVFVTGGSSTTNNVLSYGSWAVTSS